jgi:hypothetical protein
MFIFGIGASMGLILSMGAVESLPEFLWRIVMKLPEFNLFSDKSA